MTDDPARRTAYHEAGHVVGHIRLHVPFRKVTIVSEGDVAGCVTGRPLPRALLERMEGYGPTLRDIDRLERECIVFLAGSIAEDIGAGDVDPDQSEHDRSCVVDIILRLSGGLEEAEAWRHLLWVRAHGLVKNRWPQVEAVAAALLERKRLTAVEARAIVFAALKATARPTEPTREA